MIGSVITHYKIVEKLGEGGMGVVYKAEDLNLERYAALKFLPPAQGEDEVDRERLRREAKAASALNHPNVCTIYGMSEHDGRQFIEMEYVDGVSLKSRIKEAPLALEEVIAYAIQIGEALSEAHGRGITHRDIKPENIRINSRNQIKVMDFGLAKLKGSLQLTRTSGTVGTVAYMSPEQVRGGEVDPRSDLFSFGVVLYEMISRRNPFRREHEAATMYSIVYEEPEPFAKQGLSVPPELEQIVFRSLVKDPEQRYQSAAALVNDLRTHFAPNSSASGISRPAPAAPPRSGLSVRMLAGAGIAAAAVIALLFLLLHRPAGDASSGGLSRKTFAVMYIENIPDEQDKDRTAEMLANLLSTSLSQVKGLVVISRERLYGIQQELGEEASTLTNPAVVSRIARHAGVGTMLMGSIIQAQPALTLTTHLVDVGTGAILSSQRIENYPPGRIFSLVDSLAVLVRSSLSVPLEAAAEARSLSEVTTASVEAYRSYLAGLELKGKFFDAEAEAAWKKAIELDSSFAMAYYKLSTLETLDLESRKRSIEKAFQLRNRVTEKERLQIEAAYANVIEGDPEKAIEVLENLSGKYPHEQNVYHMLHAIYRELWNRDKAIEANVRAVRNDSLDKNAWNNLAYYYADKNLRTEALDAVDRYILLSPAEPNPYDTKGDVYAKFGDGDSAVLWYRKALSFRPDYWTTAEKIGFIKLLQGDYAEARNSFRQYGSWPGAANKGWAEIDDVLSLMHQGKLRRAEGKLLELLPVHRAGRLKELVAAEYQLLAHIARQRGDGKALLRYAQEYASYVKPDPDAVFRGADLLVRGYAANGKGELAARLLASLDTPGKKRSPGFQIALHRLRALAACDQERYADAVSEFQQAFEREPVNYRHDLSYAVSLIKLGRLPEAVGELRRVSYYIDDELPDQRNWPLASVTSHYWLGIAYEQQHNHAGALREFETVLRVWSGADADLPLLADARKHAAALNAGM